MTKRNRTKRTEAVFAFENRRTRFERIGKVRMNKALTAIRLLGNLSSSNYEWNQRDVRTMQDTLLYSVGVMVSRYNKVRAERLTFAFPQDKGKVNDQPRLMTGLEQILEAE